MLRRFFEVGVQDPGDLPVAKMLSLMYAFVIDGRTKEQRDELDSELLHASRLIERELRRKPGVKGNPVLAQANEEVADLFGDMLDLVTGGADG